jgi:RimJ/RimL family protein N-acetyltransferase
MKVTAKYYCRCWCFVGTQRLRLARLAAVTAPENTASISVLQRLGFVDAGTLVWPDSGETCALFDCDLSSVVG